MCCDRSKNEDVQLVQEIPAFPERRADPCPYPPKLSAKELAMLPDALDVRALKKKP